MFHIPVHKKLGVRAPAETVEGLVSAMESSWENLERSACLKMCKIRWLFSIQLSSETVQVSLLPFPAQTFWGLDPTKKKIVRAKNTTDCVQLRYRKLSV